jgi:hypothetical protein
MTQQIRTAFLLAQGASLRQYIGAGITFFNFPFISVSVLSAFSVSPSLHLHRHLHLPPYLHLPCHLLNAAISLHYTEKHKIFITGANNLLRLAIYS